VSVRLMSEVWDIDLPASDKIVLLALADNANDDGLCWPGMAHLVAKCSKGERTIQASIKRLVTLGHLTRQEILGKGCKYTVHPRRNCTPAKSSPPQKLTKTPAKSAGKPSRTTIKTKGKRASVLPDGWVPSEFGKASKSFAIVDGWSVDELTEHIERFTAHHTARGNKFPDWQAAWSTWVLNTKKFEQGRKNGNRPANDTITNPYVAAVARRETERAGAGF
jgi:hypothetical protein